MLSDRFGGSESGKIVQILYFQLGSYYATHVTLAEDSHTDGDTA